MCRHLGYLGPSASVGELLTRGDHALRTQAWAPREMRGGGTVNADGFGVAWWVSAPGGPPVTRYRNADPIWTDPAVDEVLPHLRSTSVLAAIRSATVGMPVERAACAPFTHAHWAFSHNGRIPDWQQVLTAIATDFDSPSLLEAESRTDSATLWVILRGLLESHSGPANPGAAQEPGHAQGPSAAKGLDAEGAAGGAQRSDAVGDPGDRQVSDDPRRPRVPREPAGASEPDDAQKYGSAQGFSGAPEPGGARQSGNALESGDVQKSGGVPESGDVQRSGGAPRSGGALEPGGAQELGGVPESGGAQGSGGGRASRGKQGADGGPRVGDTQTTGGGTGSGGAQGAGAGGSADGRTNGRRPGPGASSGAGFTRTNSVSTTVSVTTSGSAAGSGSATAWGRATSESTAGGADGVGRSGGGDAGETVPGGRSGESAGGDSNPGGPQSVSVSVGAGGSAAGGHEHARSTGAGGSTAGGHERARSTVDPGTALARLARAVLARAPSSRLNLLLGDGETLWATTVHHSLSVLLTDDLVVVSSEPYDDDPRWQAIADRRLVVARPGYLSVASLEPSPESDHPRT